MTAVSVLAGVAGALLVFTGYLAAVETVATRVSLVRALRLEDEARRGAGALLWLIEHRATALNVLLVATVTARVALTAAVVGIAVSYDMSALGLLGVLAVLVVVSLIISEVMPRTIALRHLEATGLRLASSARFGVRVLDPLARIIVTLGRAVVPRQHEVSGPYASDDEIDAFDGDDASEDDALEPEERAMIRSIFELADTRVREIMTPRPDMVTIAENAPFSALVDIVNTLGYSRLPVHAADDPDKFVGVVYAKDLLARVSAGDHNGAWDDLIRPATFVPETKRGDDLLRELQASAVHMAIVVDEYGAIAGLVTIEDILEEIVGEIVDEHDHEEPLVEALDDGTFRIDARLSIDDLNELLATELPEEGWDTVGGLVLGTLGRVAVEGESIDISGVSITVESVQGRRVVKVLVRAEAHEDDEDAAEADKASSPVQQP